jgi:dihydroorotate dehydrogenase electron transfer subunit
LNILLSSSREVTKGSGIHVLEFFDPEGVYKNAQPGQFVKMKCGDSFLLRPISIAKVNKDILSLIVEAKGPGTQFLTKQDRGRVIDTSAPIGKGFDLSPLKGDKRFLLIGGGVGVAPVSFAYFKLASAADLILCYSNKQKVINIGGLTPSGSRVVIATDDGSVGKKGRADEILEKHLRGKKSSEYGMILACGPKLMLKSIAEIAERLGVPCQVSMEERMACAVDACKGCTVLLKNGKMATVCHDGPVFDTRMVDWNV